MDSNKYIQFLAQQNFRNVISAEFEVGVLYYFKNGIVDSRTIQMPFVYLISNLITSSLVSEVNYIEVSFGGKHFFDVVNGDIIYHKNKGEY